MNIYTHTFAATCPSDGDLIVYRLEIRSETMIRVEHIKAASAQFKSGYQETIADELQKMIGGDQRMTAVHQGVTIETVRGHSQSCNLRTEKDPAFQTGCDCK